jgi:tetratricopeptide (TPR) repeat protein
MNNPRGICFVIQGFGEKTDFTTGRKLNLDASYAVIKEGVEAAGLKCIRADEIQHSGVIDVPMYEHILRADLVIADVSTYNVNAVYELGVRYGLRPHATIIVAEDGFRNPFDVNHNAIRTYKHLGEDIGHAEARRFKEVLKTAIQEIMARPTTDSPVYTYLPRLTPPSERAPAAEGAPSRPLAAGVEAASAEVPATSGAPSPAAGSAKELLDRARRSLDADDFAGAKSLLTAVKVLRPHDDFVTQQLALTTYKSKLPDPRSALLEAHGILKTLRPEVSNDPETLGLWGAIHKRLWELSGEQAMLDEAISAYERGFYLKADYYNGINLAFLLNQRAAAEDGKGLTADAIADFITARRVRLQVLKSCRDALAAGGVTDEERYWIEATALEAAVGLEDAAEESSWTTKVQRAAVAGWMSETTNTQVGKLRSLLAASPLRHLRRA